MTVIHGDCLEVMATLDAESIDAIVTDPPYGLGFMGKDWDHGLPGPPFWAAALRVAKPGAHLLAFGGTRTYHRLAAAIEDAGWEIRDCLVWAYASGFPKSHNLDGEWQGWGTALKPAWEPIVMARKPLRGTVAANVLAYGTGALNIDGTRIGWASSLDAAASAAAAGYADSRARGTARQSVAIGQESRDGTNRYDPVAIAGRWPANVILTDAVFDGGWDGVVGGGWTDAGTFPTQHGPEGVTPFTFGNVTSPADAGTYSRFFLIPKASRTDREPVGSTGERSNVHPTVKPVGLMRHLVRLVTPPGGTVLDPFLGSGSTALAAEAEGFAWVGIEKEAEYVAIAEARLNGTPRGLGI